MFLQSIIKIFDRLAIIPETRVYIPTLNVPYYFLNLRQTDFAWREYYYLSNIWLDLTRMGIAGCLCLYFADNGVRALMTA